MSARRNGEFKDFQVRTMVADYCRDITLGYTGWGISFTEWVELTGKAKFVPGEGLKKLDDPETKLHEQIVNDINPLGQEF